LPNAGRESVNPDDPEHLAFDVAGFHYLLNDCDLHDVALDNRGLESMRTMLRVIAGIKYQIN
jgi:hypothetical protein